MKKLLVIGALFLLFSKSKAQSDLKVNQDSIAAKMEWFADAKLGIFIHWGIYSVKGIGESWSFHNKLISYPDYMAQIKGFTAKNYHPQQWADLIKESGAKYAVMTSKHHDGVALWGTKQNNRSIPAQSAAHRDVLAPFVNAIRKDGIKVGIYYSLLDWSDKNYPGFLKDSSRYEIKDDPSRWADFVKYDKAQLKELQIQFNPDLWWFDGDWEHSAAEWDAKGIRKQLIDYNPKTIINGRLQGYGDYSTPEQNFPITHPNLRWWELCMTTNDNWGWQPQDKNFKTPYEVITIFADCISNGGNLLLDIGPKEDGTIPPEEVNVLKTLGSWVRKHAEAIYETREGMSCGHFYGPSTLSKDGKTLYLFLPSKTSGEVVIKGLDTKINRITVVGNGQELTPKIVGKISWSKVPGLVYIPVPENIQDKYVTVLKVQLATPIKLYEGAGGL